jgi:hypothetical protein
MPHIIVKCSKCGRVYGKKRSHYAGGTSLGTCPRCEHDERRRLDAEITLYRKVNK